MLERVFPAYGKRFINFDSISAIAKTEANTLINPISLHKHFEN